LFGFGRTPRRLRRVAVCPSDRLTHEPATFSYGQDDGHPCR
jgi:hypothetical protein